MDGVEFWDAIGLLSWGRRHGAGPASYPHEPSPSFQTYANEEGWARRPPSPPPKAVIGASAVVVRGGVAIEAAAGGGDIIGPYPLP